MTTLYALRDMLPALRPMPPVLPRGDNPVEWQKVLGRVVGADVPLWLLAPSTQKTMTGRNAVVGVDFAAECRVCFERTASTFVA